MFEEEMHRFRFSIVKSQADTVNNVEDFDVMIRRIGRPVQKPLDDPVVEQYRVTIKLREQNIAHSFAAE